MSTPTDPITVPVPMPTRNALPPFLVKTYDMVDDPSSDNAVSWSSTNNSFIIHELPEFDKLLPKKFSLEEEVERLKRDRNVLMKELVRLRKQHQTTDNQIQTMMKRLQGMEQRQQQMMSFFAKVVNSPSFLSHFLQHQNETTKLITKGSKKCRLKQDGVVSTGHNELPDSQSVKYQPIITLGNSSHPSKTFSQGIGPGVTVPGQMFSPEVTRDQSVPLEANSNVVATSPLAVIATSPLAVGQELPYKPDDLHMVSNDAFIGPNLVPSDVEVVATSPLAIGQEFPYIPDNLDMVPNDAFIGLDMVPSDIENFLLNSNNEEWNNNLLVKMDKYITGLQLSCDQLLQPNPEVGTTQEWIQSHQSMII
nr:heat shock factor protein HSF8-like [Tanacetum cinerariifolium]